MVRHVLLMGLLMIPGGSCALRAEQVIVTGVSGQVLYGSFDTTPGRSLHPGQRLGPGVFSCGANGILYVSTFDGSELRLAEMGTLRYDGADGICRMEGQAGARSTFHLLKGKLEVRIKFRSTPPHCYHIVLPRAKTSMSYGQCVICMHGGDAFLFVAQGMLAVSGDQAEPGPDQERTPLEREHTPIYGAVPVVQKNALTPVAPMVAEHGELLIGNGQVGVVSAGGDIRMQPLSALAAATQNCLLAGFNPEVEGADGKKASPDSNVVSPTQ